MPSVEIAVTLKMDGALLSGFPVIKRLEVDEATGRVVFEQPNGGGYAVVASTSILSEIQVLFLQPDKQVTVRLDGQSDAGIVLNAHGLLIIVDADIDAGALTNVTTDNSSGSTALIRAFAGGT